MEGNVIVVLLVLMGSAQKGAKVNIAVEFKFSYK